MNNTKNVNDSSLLEEIRALSFVKAELELYLDTHPECAQALDYYTKTVNALDAMIEEYNNTVAPLSAAGAAGRDKWTWVNTPWPWQNGAGNVSASGKGRA